MYAFKTGIYLTVHNQTELPHTLPPGLGIQTGFRTYVGINREYTKKLSGSYSDCLDDLNSENIYSQKLFSYFNDLNVTFYDQNFCFTMCYQDQLIDACNCQDIKTPIIRNSTYCVNSSQVKCFNEFDNYYAAADLNYLCENACPQKCTTMAYNLETSSKFSFPTLSYLRFLQASEESVSSKFPVGTNDSFSIEFSRNGFLKVVVNYDNLYYTSFHESPSVTPNDMFGLVGGQLGLFLGISILSFIEIVEIIIDSIFIYCKNKKEKSYQIRKVESEPRLSKIMRKMSQSSSYSSYSSAPIFVSQNSLSKY